MEEEFQGGVCGGNWWNSSRNLFGSSSCSAAINDPDWLNPSLIVDIKTAKSISDDSAGSVSDGSVVLQEAPKPQPHLTSNGNLPIDSTLHMMADDWNQDFLHDSARSQENYSHMMQIQSLNSSMNCRQKIADEWTTADFSADQNFITNSFSTSAQSAATLPATSFPLNTGSYNYSTSSLLQTLFDADHSQSQQQPLLENEATNYSSSQNFQMNSAAATAMKPSFPKQQLANNFQFINNSNFWNATAASSGDVRAIFLPSSTSQLIPSALTKPKLNQQNFGSKNLNGKAGEGGFETKKGGNEPAFKRPRIETPSPLPTFKVRKEKLGDRVTALQQLVSPFGKTDTASVLHEAIDYIKLLHDQVTVLSTPYLKNGPPPLQRQQAHDKIKDQEEATKDLRSRGLCLVPISSTFPVATETTADFWTPTFGASFR